MAYAAMRSIALALVALAACGDNQQGTPDAAAGPDAHFGFTEAAHPSPPVVSAGAPGTVLTTPHVVPIFFANDDAEPQIEQFLAMFAADPVYWPATTSEYGVGAITIQPSVVSTAPPPTTDADLQTFLSANIGPTGAFGALDPQAIYTVFLPEGAGLDAGGQACKAFGGYHSEIPDASGGPSIVYALLPRCHYTGDAEPLDPTTVATSHELVEASTDPHFYTDPGYRFLDANDQVVSRTPGGELGDMCEYLPSAGARIIGSFMVQRTWSNNSAAAGHDPCVPAPATPYAGAGPVFTTQVPFGRSNMPTNGVSVQVGTSVTLEVDLFTDGEIPVDFEVSAMDTASITGGAPQLDFQWNQLHGNNGDKLQLMVTRTIANTSRGNEFVIWTLVGGRYVGFWWGLVTD